MRRESSNIVELLRALAVLAEPPHAETERLSALLALGAPPSPAAYTELFVFQLYPYAAVYLGAEGMLGGEARDRIAGFWRALGDSPPAEPDHLVVLLAQYANLAEGEASESSATRRAAVRRARATLLWEHLLSWLPAFLAKARELAPEPYQQWASLLDAVLHDEAEHVNPPALLPLHLREAPPLPDPARGDRRVFCAAVLAPVRSGLILTRSDLARAARDIGLAIRAGERRFILESMLDQSADATWSWLQREATAWAERHRDADRHAHDVGEFWSQRARSAARTFGHLAARSARASRRAPTA